MYKFSGLLLLAFLFFVSSVTAQYDTTLPAMDTTVLTSDNFIDTEIHMSDMDAQYNAQEERKARAYLKFNPAQSAKDKLFLKKQTEALTARNMHGRGYVKGGLDSAGKYILKKFVDYKMKPVIKNGPYTQGFAFPINTFPTKMNLFINGDSLKPGSDYLIEPASSSFGGENLKVRKIDLNDISDRAAWKIVLGQMTPDKVYYLTNVDLFCSKILQVKRNVFLAMLPKACYLIPQEGRMQWTVSRDTIAATVFNVRADILAKTPKTVNAVARSVFIPKARSQNIVARVPGIMRDSFIVFAAHYDHLGMMGDTTVFPGASDDASGIALMFYLAAFYEHRVPRYTIIFIAFAGEEASLMGSEFFVKNPMIPLKNIKFLINMDMMGDATNGITVVNATEFPRQFGLLKEINDTAKLIPELRSKGPAANSDHYYFARAGVPSFFIYTNGGKGFYHDIYDKPKELSETNVDGVGKLLLEFTREIR